VKITGDAVASLDENLESMTIPEPIVSDDDWAADMEDLLQVALDPIDSSLFPTTVVEEPLADPEVGEFLMDAVDWL